MPSFVGERYIGLEERVRKACHLLLSVNTKVTPIRVRGNRSKSLLFDACVLAKVLIELREEKWKIISKMWVELLAYAASHCKGNAHV